MPQLIQLEPLPNQGLTIRLGEHRYEISIKSVSADLMCISFVRDNVTLTQRVRAMPSMMILPKHKEMGKGNFAFITVNDEKFGSDHQLYYYAPEEV